MLDLKTYDNVNLKLVDGLRESIRKGDRLAIAGAAFSIYAYEALREELSGGEELRFLYTSPTFSSDKAKKSFARILHSATRSRTCALRDGL